MARTKKGRRRERAHRPEELGPRIIWFGRWAGADFRPWGMGRRTLRDPKHPQWPAKGDRTTDEEVARRWARQYVEQWKEHERRTHLGLPGKAPALGRLVDEWLRLRSTPGDMQVEPATYATNVSVTARLRGWATDAMPIDRIAGRREGPKVEDRRLYLQDYFNELLARGYARSTVQTERAVLSGFFRWAGHPVVGQTKVPAPEDRDIFTWSDTQLKRLRKAADTLDEIRKPPYPEARLAVELALGTGCRQQELFALRWEDMDEHTVRISRQRNRLLGTGTKPLKGKLNRSALLLRSLTDYLAGTDWRDRTGWVLHEGDGRPVRYQRTVTLITRLLDTAGLAGTGRGWHDFRRTYGRLFLEAAGGSGLHLLQVYLGHKKLETTQKSYGHLSSDHATRIGRDLLYGNGLHVVR